MTNTIWQWLIPSFGTAKINAMTGDSFPAKERGHEQESEKEAVNFYRYFFSLTSL
jgi:hypothetical protein